jgi:hypothetical protein
MQFLGSVAVLFASLSTKALRSKNMGQYKSGGTDFKREYAKEQLRENMGQSESKERDFNEQKTLEMRF